MPSGMHAEHACIVAKHKINVLCEKPLDVTASKMQKNCVEVILNLYKIIKRTKRN